MGLMTQKLKSVPIPFTFFANFSRPLILLLMGRPCLGGWGLPPVGWVSFFPALDEGRLSAGHAGGRCVPALRACVSFWVRVGLWAGGAAGGPAWASGLARGAGWVYTSALSPSPLRFRRSCV